MSRPMEGSRSKKAVALAAVTLSASVARPWSSSSATFVQARQPWHPTGRAQLQQHRRRATAAPGHAGAAVGVAAVGAGVATLMAALGRPARGRRGACWRVVRSAETSENQAKWQRFFQWIAARGGNMEKVDIAEVNGMRGLVAAQDIAEDEPIAEIPIGASIDISDPVNTKDPSANALNLLRFLREDADALGPYFDILPGRNSEDMIRMPDFYTDEEMDMLQCPVVAEKTRRRRQLCAAKAAEASVEADDVQWALCTVAQRAFSVLSPIDGLLRLMLPGIDLFNHDAHAQHRMKVRWNLEGYVDATFKVIAGSPIKKGEEIRICYGGSPFRPDGCGGDCTGDVALNNSQYLQRYGFVDECIGTTMVDGKWLVTSEAESIRQDLAQTTVEADEALLADRSLSLPAQTAVQFRRHLKRALTAQREVEAQAAKAEARKSEAEKLADQKQKEKEEQEAQMKAANAEEAKKQLMKAIEE